MLGKALNRCVEERRLTTFVLVFALVFVVAHVALHDLKLNRAGLYGNDECQVCRLNHVPIVSAAPSAAFGITQPSTHLLPVEVAEYHLSHLFHSLWARAPPLA